MGLTPITLWLACLLAVRNQRILTAWDARQADDARRAAAGLPPKTRARRRKTLASLTSSTAITLAPPIPRPSPARPRSPRPRHGEHNPLPGTATAARQPSLESGSSQEHARRAPKCQTQT